MKDKVFLLLILVSMVCTTAFAQEVTAPVEVIEIAPEAPTRFDIGAGYWYTGATLDSFTHDPDLGGKVSELHNTLNAGLFIINVEAYLFWKLYADVFVGWGDFEGDHKDSDWRLPEEEFSDEFTWGELAEEFDLDLSEPFSVSKSDADGDVTTWNANGYLRIIENLEDNAYLDVSLGYLYYQDDIEHLRNSRQVIDEWEAVDIPIEGHDSQDKYTFDGIRFGLRGRFRIHENIAVKIGGGMCPWLNVENEGFWNLREMEIDADADGIALDINISIEFKITKYLFFEAGYKYISLNSDVGDDTRTWSNGTQITFEDTFEVEATRGGFYGMGKLKI